MGGSKEKTGRNLHTAHRKSQGLINLFKASEMRYQDLFNNASDAIFTYDLEGNIIEVNEAAVALTGYTHNDLTRMNISEFLTAESFKLTMKKQKALLEDETATQRYELELIRKDGVSKNAELATSLITYNGRPIGIQAIAREITKRKRLEHVLNERVKELQAFYGIAEIAERADITLDEVYQEVVNLLPSSWQYPEITYARITINGKKFETTNYRDTEWKQSSDIKVCGVGAGIMEVGYLEERPELDEGPFLKEERLLIDAVAERLGRITERKRAEEELETRVQQRTAQLDKAIKALRIDITKRKQAEQRLQFLSSIVEQAKDSVIVTNLNYEIEYVNKAAEELFGYTREELIGLTPLIFNAEPMAEDIQKNIYKTVSFGETITGSILNKRKDGSTFVCEFKVSPLCDKDGQILSYIGIQRDITEKKRVEEELSKFKTIADRAGYGAGIIRPDGNLIYVNESFAGMHGYTVEELIGKHFSILHTKEQMKLVEILTDQLIQTGNHVAGEVWHKRKDGTVFPTLMTGTAIKDDKGKPLYLSATAVDITERKQAIEALSWAEQNFRNSLDNSPLGIRIVTAEGELLYANQAILDIYGYSSVEELRAIPVKERYTPESYAEYKERKEKRRLGKPVPSNYEISIVRKDGEIRRLAVFRKEVVWNGKTQFQAIYQDITEKKQAQEEIVRLLKTVETTREAINVTSADGTIIYTNCAMDELFGYEKGELIGKYPSVLNAGPTPEAVTKEIMAVTEKKGYWEGEIHNKRKDGTEFLSYARITSLVDKDGKILNFLSTQHNITERKRVEMALRQSEEFNSSLLSNSPSPVLVLNADTSIKYVNPALEKLTGFSSTELIGRKPPYPWWAEETREALSRWLAKVMRSGGGKCEQLFRKKNGERLWVEITYKAVKVDGELKYHLANWVDLTERKRLRENMQFYVSEITRAQEEERKRVAREIHDESVQSLAVLALDIDAITKEKERLPEDVILRLERLRAEADSILEGLRRFSHELRPGVIDQVGLVPALEILTEELNKEGRVNTSLQIMGSERRLTPEIEVVLFRIVQEGLRNVKRHSRATKAAIRIKFTRRKVRLTIVDNGRGFELPRVLSDLATEGKLGLIGMQERTRLLNGKFSVKSRRKRGTVVAVEVRT